MGVEVLFTSMINHVSKSSVGWLDGQGVQFIGEKQSSSKTARNLIRSLYPLYSALFLLNLRIRSFQGEVVFLWTPKGLFTDLYALLYLKVILKKRIVCEKNELSKGIKANLQLKSKRKPILTALASLQMKTAALQDELVRYFDHVLAISTNMHKWVYRRNKRVSLIPILIDSEDVCLKDTRALPIVKGSLRIGFFGTLDNQKEGLFDFIKVLARFHGHNVYRFDIYGFAPAKVRADLKTIISNNGMEDSVFVYDPLPGDLARAKMMDYDLLVMPRKSNMQNDYGFSTKLGEYLISGAAVLVTSVSDNGCYIRDQVNGFITPPDDSAGLDLALRQIFVNRESLPVIGQKGQLLALDKFSYEIHAQAIYAGMFGNG